MFCKHCGNEVNDQAAVCTKCGCATNGNRPTEIDTPSTGLNVLGFFFPLIGLILYLVWKNEYPLRAQGIGKWSLISVIISIVIYVIYFALIGAALGGYAGGYYY